MTTKDLPGRFIFGDKAVARLCELLGNVDLQLGAKRPDFVNSGCICGGDYTKLSEKLIARDTIEFIENAVKIALDVSKAYHKLPR